MNDLTKVVKFEQYKIRHNKLACCLVVSIFLLFILIVSINYFCIMPTNEHVLQNKELTMKEYENNLSEYTLLLANSPSLSKDEIKRYEDACARLKFYIESNTTEYDYLNSELLSEKIKGQELVGFMFYFSSIASFVLWAFTIGISAYFFVWEYKGGQYKNLIASGVCRKIFFEGKLIVCLLVSITAFLILFFYAFSFGLAQSSSKFLIIFNGHYMAISAIYVFLSNAFSTFVLNLLFTSTTIFFGVALKSIIVSILSSTSIYGLSLLMSFAFTNVSYSNPAFQQLYYIQYIPLLSLQLHVGWFDVKYAISIFLHLLSAFLLYSLTIKKFKKSDL